MPIWTFMDYWEANGNVPILKWILKLPKDVQAEIDTRLLSMGALERWSEKWIKKYRSVEDLYELRIPHGRVQYRPLCCYGPGPKQVTLLAGAIERGGKIKPGILISADRRLKELRKDETRAHPHKFGPSPNL